MLDLELDGFQKGSKAIRKGYTSAMMLLSKQAWDKFNRISVDPGAKGLHGRKGELSCDNDHLSLDLRAMPFQLGRAMHFRQQYYHATSVQHR